MSLKKYFKENQKIFLKSLDEDEDQAKIDALSCYFREQGAGYIDLLIPYGTSREERYPFDPDKTLEIVSDSMGVGVRLTGQFKEFLEKDVVRICHGNDLQLIHRRVEDRRDAVLKVGYTKGKGKLRSFRQQWQKNVKILETLDDLSKLPNFPEVEVNISMTGVGFKIKTPIEVADLCLLFIDLKDGLPPVCTMTEVVWRSEEEFDGRCMTGFQFLNILESDRKRIRKFVRTPPENESR